MYDNLNSLIKSYNIKNKKESPIFIYHSKISEINNISTILTNYKNNNLQASTNSLNLKNNSKKLEISTISLGKNNLSKASNNNKSPFHLFRINDKSLLKKFSFKKNNLRKIIFDKSKVKSYIKYNKINHSKLNTKNLSVNKMNISFNNISTSNISNKNNNNDKNKDKINFYNLKLNNAKLSFNKNKIKLFKKQKNKNINKYDILSNKDFFIHFNSLLDNIIRQKEKELDKHLKISSDKKLIEKVYKNFNLFNRKNKKNKKFNPILQEYNHDNTISIEYKKNIPYLYNNYLNKTKKTYNNLNTTYCDLKNDIIYDIIYEQKSKYKKRPISEKELKYEEIIQDVREMKQDIGYEKPSIELFTNKSSSFQYLSGMFDRLNKLDSNIAYKYRVYLANKYGIDLRKDLLKIEVENEDHLYKFQKTIPK